MSKMNVCGKDGGKNVRKRGEGGREEGRRRKGRTTERGEGRKEDTTSGVGGRGARSTVEILLEEKVKGNEKKREKGKKHEKRTEYGENGEMSCSHFVDWAKSGSECGS